MSREPDANVTVGLNLTALKRNLGILVTSMEKAGVEINARQALIAAKQQQIANGVTANQQAQLNKQIANHQGFITAYTQQLNVLQGKQQQYYQAIANYAANAATATARAAAATAGAGGAGGGGGGVGGIAGGVVGGMFGGRGGSPLGRALISAGFAMRGVPGLGALSSLSIGAGFGGGPGITGAIAGLTAGAVSEGIQKLIGLYEDLAKASYNLWMNHDRLQNSFELTTQTVGQHFFPALRGIQEEEVKIGKWLEEHQDMVGNFTDQMARLAVSGNNFVESLIKFVTNSPTIEKAMGKIGGVAGLLASVFASKMSADLDLVSGLLTNPGGVIMAPLVMGISNALYKKNPAPPPAPGTGNDEYRQAIDFALRNLNKAEVGQKDKDLAKRKQLEDLTETINKRKEELKALQQIAQLDDNLLSDDYKRTRLAIDHVQALKDQLNYKETIAMNELVAKKQEEAAAEKRLKEEKGDAIEKAQVESKLQDAKIARVKAENDLKGIRISNAKEIADAEIKERDRLNKLQEEADKTFRIRTPARLTRADTGYIPPWVITGPGPALEHQRAVIETRMAHQQSLIDISQTQYDQAPASQRPAMLVGIEALKTAQGKFNEELITTLQLLLTTKQEGTEDYIKIAAAIDHASESAVKLQKKTMTTGEMLSSTFELIVHHASAFNSVLGSAVGRAAILGKSILDLSKITIGDSDKAAGSVFGGLKEGFSTKSKALTQGIPEVGAIAAAAISLVTSLHALFTKAAKAMAEAISKEVNNIVSATSESGRIAEGLSQLETQRIKALTELSSKKGGQKQLETLLPEINKQIEALKKQQTDISDNFNDVLDKLRMGSPFDAIFDSVHAAQKQIDEFLKSVNSVDDNMGKVQEFLDLTYNKMSTDWKQRWDEAWKAWGQGAENAAGELISIDKEAVEAIDKENDNYDKSETQRSKSLAALKKNYAKQQADDIKKLSKLQQSLNDLNDQEVKDILTIQNEGIAERQKTTGDDKRQRIADLQDQAAKQRQDIVDQINDLEDVRAEREISYNEAIQQSTDEEALAQTNHENAIKRIINETDRKREAFLENLENLKKEKAFIDGMQQSSTDWLNNWVATFHQIPTGGVFVDQITINLSNPNLTADEIARAVRDGLDNAAKLITLT